LAGAVVVSAIVAVVYAGNNLVKFVGVSSDATEDNLAAEAQDDACLPGQRVPILEYPHISEQAATGVVHNSNPATSGPHYSAALAPGIYRTHTCRPGRPSMLRSTGASSSTTGRIHPRASCANWRASPSDTLATLSCTRTLRSTRRSRSRPGAASTRWTATTRNGYSGSFDQLLGRSDHHSTAATNECQAGH